MSKFGAWTWTIWDLILKTLRAVRRAWYSLVALLESFIRMEHLFEYMFMALGYLLGSHLATWEVLGTLFGVIFGPSGHFWGHFGCPMCVQKIDGAPKVPQEALTPKFPHPFGDLLGPQITKSRLQRHPKTSSGNCREKVFLRSAILRSSTCLKCVRGLQNQGFHVFEKGRKHSPTGSHFGTILGSELSPVDQKRGSKKCFKKR